VAGQRTLEPARGVESEQACEHRERREHTGLHLIKCLEHLLSSRVLPVRRPCQSSESVQHEAARALEGIEAVTHVRDRVLHDAECALLAHAGK